ncbi:cytochrome d ubiquinol oxidase subunit II [Marinigracilibium pacificum]|uniref:Cytochrome d ubiquinol oxidase subunit II n=1 Tax=Marinigracilibium pacificum TaxID=2729599 RepID=A0A848IXW1_9BACT|nr:cytochrome d ubiquinol oxidase subunit II [Marinigracilibium pacificum]NMM48161.1 cytochrome d ubiquinol oxidase subunit II [Marinigracilibium pacificum]
MDFNVIWYVIVGVLLMGYAILDGFDLGVGILYLFSKGDHDRRILLNSIGPVWDGNEVWLITAGGALFAAFPEVYATAFSGFYLPFMLLLIALIFRAVSIEFRSKEESKRWRKNWDIAFSAGSVVAALLFGIAIGNIIIGMALDQEKIYVGSFLDLITPYTFLTGIFNVVMFAMHGAIYLTIKTEGKLQLQIKKLAYKAFGLFVILFIPLTALTLFEKPEMIANFSFGNVELPGTKHELIEEHQFAISIIAWTVVLLNILSIMNIPRMLSKDKYISAFLSSACTMGALIMLFALGIFPNMIISSIDPLNNLDIYNGSSSQYTLRTMFFVAIWGMPFVIAYTTLIYWTYRGKTKLNESSY